MQELLQYLPLKNDEKVLGDIEGDLYYVSPNGYVQMLYAIIKFFAIITGCRFSARVVVTNKRVIIIKAQKYFWFFMNMSSVNSIPVHAISSVGCYFLRTFMVCQNYYLNFSSRTTGFYLRAKGGPAAVHEMIEHILKLQEA